MEKLVVFIAAYICEKQVTRVLSQLLDKRIAPWVGECIVVNNRATDGTESAVQDWMARHPDAPVRLLRKTRNPPAQSTMADPAGRRANVSGAYEPERAARLDGRRVLLIDDIQFIIGKESSQLEFFNTFETLFQLNKQIVISSDKPPRDMPELDDRYRTRFSSGLLVDIQPPDYETRMEILNNFKEKIKVNNLKKLIKRNNKLNTC